MIQDSRIWILEDEQGGRFVYERVLGIRYKIEFFPSLASFREKLSSSDPRPDLIIADLALTDGNFMTFLANSDDRKLVVTPFIIVSSLIDVDAFRFCYDEGALDFLVKPFKKAELIAKVEHALARGQIVETELNLKGKELAIFQALYSAPNKTLAREDIARIVWRETVDTRTIDVHICLLRKKLAANKISLTSDRAGSWTISDNRVKK